jgi:hypothetical protein
VGWNNKGLLFSGKSGIDPGSLSDMRVFNDRQIIVAGFAEVFS